MGRRSIYYNISGGESGTESEEKFDVYPTQASQEEEDPDYQIVDEWDASMDENIQEPADVGKEDQEALTAGEDADSDDTSIPLVGMGVVGTKGEAGKSIFRIK